MASLLVRAARPLPAHSDVCREQIEARAVSDVVHRRGPASARGGLADHRALDGVPAARRQHMKGGVAAALVELLDRAQEEGRRGHSAASMALRAGRFWAGGAGACRSRNSSTARSITLVRL